MHVCRKRPAGRPEPQRSCGALLGTETHPSYALSAVRMGRKRCQTGASCTVRSDLDPSRVVSCPRFVQTLIDASRIDARDS